MKRNVEIIPDDCIQVHSVILEGDDIQVYSPIAPQILLPMCDASSSCSLLVPQTPPRNCEISNEDIISSQSSFDGTIDNCDTLAPICSTSNYLFHNLVHSIENLMPLHLKIHVHCHPYYFKCY